MPIVTCHVCAAKTKAPEAVVFKCPRCGEPMKSPAIVTAIAIESPAQVATIHLPRSNPQRHSGLSNADKIATGAVGFVLLSGSMISIFAALIHVGFLVLAIFLFSAAVAVFNSLNPNPLRLRKILDFRGMSLTEVVSIGGSPSGRTNRDGKSFFEWIVPKFRISLVFDGNDICQGVHHVSTGAPPIV